jgi:hypothetical protein
MAKWEHAVITNNGLSLQSKILAGSTLEFTKVKTGAGSVTATSLQQQTGVTNPKQEFLFSGNPYYLNEPGSAELPFTLNNDGLKESYNCYQIGLYANDPDKGEILYAIMQSATALEVPTSEQIPGWSAEFNVAVQFGNAESVSVQISAAGLSEHINNRENPHSVTAEQIGAVPLDGSVPMTGDLQISKKAKPTVKLIDVSTSSGETENLGEIQLKNSGGVYLSHYNKEFDKTVELQVAAGVNDPIRVEVEGVAYNLFGEHNTDLLKNYVLPLDGSVSMTGDLQISKKAKPAVKLIDVSTSGETDDTGEFLLRSSLGVCLSHYNKETDKTAELRVSADSINPIKVEVEGVAYNLFGEHNTDLLKNHVLPLDGSVSMGGNLIVEKEGWIGVKLRNPSTGREGRLAHSSNQNLVQFANYKDDNNLSFVALNNESNALNTMLQLSVKKEGNSVSYNIFGEHNTELLATHIQSLIDNGVIEVSEPIYQPSSNALTTVLSKEIVGSSSSVKPFCGKWIPEKNGLVNVSVSLKSSTNNSYTNLYIVSRGMISSDVTIDTVLEITEKLDTLSVGANIDISTFSNNYADFGTDKSTSSTSYTTLTTTIPVVKGDPVYFVMSNSGGSSYCNSIKIYADEVAM